MPRYRILDQQIFFLIGIGVCYEVCNKFFEHTLSQFSFLFVFSLTLPHPAQMRMVKTVEILQAIARYPVKTAVCHKNHAYFNDQIVLKK